MCNVKMMASDVLIIAKTYGRGKVSIHTSTQFTNYPTNTNTHSNMQGKNKDKLI